ncbi:hypothetical protein VTO42DRAFT_8282 [Malbranchea cinnamomea]
MVNDPPPHTDTHARYSNKLDTSPRDNTAAQPNTATKLHAMTVGIWETIDPGGEEPELLKQPTFSFAFRCQ